MTFAVKKSFQINHTFFLLLTLLIVGFSFISCSKDDDDLTKKPITSLTHSKAEEIRTLLTGYTYQYFDQEKDHDGTYIYFSNETLNSSVIEYKSNFYYRKQNSITGDGKWHIVGENDYVYLGLYANNTYHGWGINGFGFSNNRDSDCRIEGTTIYYLKQTWKRVCKGNVTGVGPQTTVEYDNGSGNNGGTNSDWGKGTWYANKSSINEVKVSKTALEEIEKAIDNNELLYTYQGHYSSSYKIDYYAERSDFVSSDGSFSTYGNQKGRLENTVNGSLYPVIRIIDDNTLVSCSFGLFVDEDMTRTDYKKLTTLFNGHIFKSVSVYLEERYYTYVRQDNKIIVTNGDFYTVTSEGLIRDGSSEPMVAFDPKKVYGVK